MSSRKGVGRASFRKMDKWGRDSGKGGQVSPPPPLNEALGWAVKSTAAVDEEGFFWKCLSLPLWWYGLYLCDDVVACMVV